MTSRLETGKISNLFYSVAPPTIAKSLFAIQCFAAPSPVRACIQAPIVLPKNSTVDFFVLFGGGGGFPGGRGLGRAHLGLVHGVTMA